MLFQKPSSCLPKASPGGHRGTSTTTPNAAPAQPRDHRGCGEARNLKIAQSGQERVQKVSWCIWTRRLLHWCKREFALVQNRVALVQETFGRPFLQLAKTPFAPSPNHFGAVQETFCLQLAKTAFAPSPNHFGQFRGFGPLQQALGLQTQGVSQFKSKLQAGRGQNWLPDNLGGIKSDKLNEKNGFL